MIETGFGIVFLIAGLTILLRTWAKNRELHARAPAAMDRSVFSTMDLEPSAPHLVHARSTKPAESFRSIEAELEPKEMDAVFAPTGIHTENDLETSSSGLLDDLERSETFPRLPLGEEEPNGPKQENLGF